MGSGDARGDEWADRVRSELPKLADANTTVASLLDGSSVLLHGSTTRGIADSYSDLDVWLLPSIEGHKEFIDFRVSNKPGQLQIESRRDFEGRIRRCDLPLIFELRDALVLRDDDGWGRGVIALARREMTEQVRDAWFAYHYIEMRSEHRSCDNSIERRDEAALLLALTSTLSHALRAAIVFDRQPYPYTKWLAASAAETATGREIVPIVGDVISLIETGALRQGGPEDQHPINLKLREIRQKLISAARSGGLDGPYLTTWWMHLDIRERVHRVVWD